MDGLAPLAALQAGGPAPCGQVHSLGQVELVVLGAVPGVGWHGCMQLKRLWVPAPVKSLAGQWYPVVQEHLHTLAAAAAAAADRGCHRGAWPGIVLHEHGPAGEQPQDQAKELSNCRITMHNYAPRIT